MEADQVSTTTQITLWCDTDKCVAWFQSDLARTKARADARKHGWSRVMVGEHKRDCQWHDLCPACTKARSS
jgi:hypothetical protein